MPAVTRIALAALALFTFQCSSSSSPAGPPATFTDVYPLIFPVTTKAQCNFCHGLPANQKSNGNLSMGMDRASAYAALVGNKSSSSRCSGYPYVVAGDPDGSLLVSKVSGPSCGDRMPLGGDPLTDAQIEMIRSWIAGGAKDD